MVGKREVKSKNQFKSDGREIADFIKKKSPQNAEKFKKEVALQLIKIKKSPKAFPPEPYLPTKNNLYRLQVR